MQASLIGEVIYPHLKTVVKPQEAKMKIQLTLPTYKQNGGNDDTVRNAEITFKAEECMTVTIIAGGKEYRVSHNDFHKVSRLIDEEFC